MMDTARRSHMGKLNDPSDESSRGGEFAALIRRLANQPLLTKEEELALIRRAHVEKRRPPRHGRRAMDQLIERNTRLILRLIKRYSVRASSSGMTTEDLFNEGAIGVQMAVDRFDTNSGLRLSTYAGWWIRHRVMRALDENDGIVRIPIHCRELAYRIIKAERIAATTGDDPSLEAIVQRVNAARAKARVVAGKGSGGMTVKLVSAKRARESVFVFHSLDAPMFGHRGSHGGDEGDATHLDQLADEKAVMANDDDSVLLTERENTALREAILTLTPHEQAILRCRFQDDMTLDETAEATLDLSARGHVVSRERIRQMQEAALAKLRRLLKYAR